MATATVAGSSAESTGNEVVARLRANLALAIKGKPREIDFLILALLAGGNVLLTDVPGVGKTTIAKSIAMSISGSFRRLQFTPDLLPADVLGGSIYNPREGSFAFRKGPIFTNVLLADEINRASPRTQSALLEAMAEGQVSIEGETHVLPKPFWVVATQNPVEYHGTYPLPEAQLDRFSVQLAMGYPPEEEELAVLSSQDKGNPVDALKPVTALDAIVEQQAQVKRVHVDADVGRYVVSIVRATREEKRLALGVSPRGGIALYRMAQAHAHLAGRSSVRPDDVKAVAVETLAHRLILETKAKYSGVTKELVVRDILARTKVPT